MSDVDTGTGPFPTDAQLSGGGFILKSNTADAVARPWYLIGNDSTFYFLVDHTTTNKHHLFSLGNIVSYKSADAYAFSISVSISAFGDDGKKITTGLGSATAGNWFARSHTQLGTAITCSKGTDARQAASATSMGANGLVYPNPADNGLYLAPINVHETTSVARGYWPGIWNPCHNNPAANNDTFSGAGTLAGKTFIIKKLDGGTVVFETSNTW